MLEYINETEASVIISSHNLNEIAEVCDRIVIIKGAKVILESSVDDLSSRFRKLTIKSENEITEGDVNHISHTSVKLMGNTAQIVVSGNVAEEIERLEKSGFTITDEQYLTLEEVFSEETDVKTTEDRIKSIFKK